MEKFWDYAGKFAILIAIFSVIKNFLGALSMHEIILFLKNPMTYVYFVATAYIIWRIHKIYKHSFHYRKKYWKNRLNKSKEHDQPWRNK